MKTYKIYSGGTRPESALYITTDAIENEHGIVVMTHEQYNRGFGPPDPKNRFDPNFRAGMALYDVTTSLSNPDVVVLHPASISFDDDRVQIHFS